MTARDDLAEDERIIASVEGMAFHLRTVGHGESLLVFGDRSLQMPGAVAEYVLRASTRWPALVQEVRELRAALTALYTFPGVRELLAPSGSLGSIADMVEAALARHEEGA